MKLTEKVYLVGGANFGYSPDGDCNVYLVDGGSGYALVDTGGGNGVTKILDNIKKMDLDPNKIKTVILTHCHFDHIGGNHEIKQKLDCNLAAFEEEVDSIQKLDDIVLYDMAQERGLSFESEQIDIKLKDGDIIKVGDIDLKIIHTSGHTPGGISILFEENNRVELFTGDTAASNGRLGFINGPGFNLKDWKASIKKLVSFKPERMYPGHNTFLLGDAINHLKLLDQKMNAPWTNIVTSVG